jgi:DNA replication protein DnaC
MQTRLPRLTNDQYDYVAKVCRNSGIPINQCPTCLAKEIEVEPGVYGFENGQYKFRGEVFDCDCQRQMDLRVHYILANIGDQFQRLDWEDFYGQGEVRDFVATYLDKWESFKVNGMGVEFSSPNLGTGKTFAATHIGKELVKRGEAVYFMDFRDVIHLLNKDSDYRNAQEDRIRETTILILDEVVAGISDAQGDLFATRFEELVRYRTNFNRITLMTTNLTPEKLHREYPRSYSLLEAKNSRVIMEGEDARQSFIRDENRELALNEEVRPIT